jgi:hypothetical protein
MPRRSDGPVKLSILLGPRILTRTHTFQFTRLSRDGSFHRHYSPPGTAFPTFTNTELKPIGR